jgi:hypothetical protein
MDQIVVNLKIKKIKFLDTATSKQTTTEMKSSLKENHTDALQLEIHLYIEGNLEISEMLFGPMLIIVGLLTELFIKLMPIS